MYECTLLHKLHAGVLSRILSQRANGRTCLTSFGIPFWKTTISWGCHCYGTLLRHLFRYEIQKLVEYLLPKISQ